MSTDNTFEDMEEMEIDTGAEDSELDIEIEDDTPEEDRGRTPLPKDVVDEIEQDELEDYSDKVKTRLKQMKKAWHDERREKERAMREQQEALRVAQQALEENKKLKTTLSSGEEELVGSYKKAAELEVEAAKRAYKEAYDSGDSDAVLEAQQKLADANYTLRKVQEYRPAQVVDTGQTEDSGVYNEASVPEPQIDPKTRAWQERNPWWGVDQEMTALALGYHQKLAQEKGAGFIGTDEYWQSIDTTMRRRFPDYFGEDDAPTRKSKPATVVAPASRSRPSKKVVLKKSQLDIAKRLGLTPEQYAREFVKMNGGN